MIGMGCTDRCKLMCSNLSFSTHVHTTQRLPTLMSILVHSIIIISMSHCGCFHCEHYDNSVVLIGHRHMHIHHNRVF